MLALLLVPAVIIGEDVMHNARYGDTTYKAGADLWKRVPEFQYVAPDTAWVIRRQIGSSVVLALWFAISVFGMVRATAKMKVQ